jgi:hypothetical protein
MWHSFVHTCRLLSQATIFQLVCSNRCSFADTISMKKGMYLITSDALDSSATDLSELAPDQSTIAGSSLYDPGSTGATGASSFVHKGRVKHRHVMIQAPTCLKYLPQLLMRLLP